MCYHRHAQTEFSFVANSVYCFTVQSGCLLQVAFALVLWCGAVFKPPFIAFNLLLIQHGYILPPNFGGG